MIQPKSRNVAALLILLWIVLPREALCQDLEPRRWTPLPIGTNVLGIGIANIEGDILFDPVLLVEDAKFDAKTAGVSYVRSFSLAGKTARFDVLVPWLNARWEGLLDGVPTTVNRVGLGDSRLRLSVNLLGPPPMKPGQYREYMASHPVRTVAGVAIAVWVPTGEYQDDKLLNLGQNRFIFRPQAGVVHTRGPWSYELTASAFLFTDNDDFWNGNSREQDPLYAVQTHVVHTFKSHLWASLSAGYGWGGRSQVNDVLKDDMKGDLLAALSLGFPIVQNQSLKFAWVRGRTRKDIGADTDTLAAAWSWRF